MYRLMMYGLIGQFVFAVLLATGNFIAYSPAQMIVSAIVLTCVAYGSNILFARVYQAVTNAESSVITALLLFFIMDPGAATWQTFWILPLASVLAMLSKYVLAIHRRHLFNPVAITAVLFHLLGIGAALWWVATPLLFPFVVIFGLLVVRKLRRFHLVFPFFVTACLVAFFRGEQLSVFVLSWPLIFFGTMMLTEPRTAPSKRRDQILYGIFVGALFASPFSIGSFSMTPEWTLVITNLFAYLASSKQVLKLTFKETKKCTAQVCDFTFVPDQNVQFIPGQFLEWTLPLTKTDTRGNRRFFTIASSPNDAEIHLGVRIDLEHGSAFKQALTKMNEGDVMYASHAAGEFVLPKDPDQKLVFVAGGIGITPFWSMIKWLFETNQKRDIILFYAANTENDFVYQQELNACADQIGMRIVYLVGKPSVGWTGKTGYITREMIESEVTNPTTRQYYFSGPPAMVESYVNLVRSIGVSKRNIKTDYFPGF